MTLSALLAPTKKRASIIPDGWGLPATLRRPTGGSGTSASTIGHKLFRYSWVASFHESFIRGWRQSNTEYGKFGIGGRHSATDGAIRECNLFVLGLEQILSWRICTLCSQTPFKLPFIFHAPHSWQGTFPPNSTASTLPVP